MMESVDFSLAGGGLLDRLMRRFGLADGIAARVVVFLAVAWLPLLILSIIEGLATGKGVKVPFLDDYGVYGRFLLAGPVLILAEIPAGRRTRDVIREFITSKFIPEQDIPLFNDATHHTMRLKESILPEIVILAIIYVVAAVRVPIALSDPLTTWYGAGHGITSAGLYYVFVSLPLFQFLLIRWIWRLAMWADLLWRISRLDLQLLPIHPDKMGGLGILGLAEIPFGLVGFAGSAIVSSYLANDMAYRGASLAASYGPMLGYVLLATLVILAPVLVFTDRLVQLRANGILRYGNVGEEYVQLFDRKWVKGDNPEGEVILGSSDIQSLADLRNSFEIVQNMSIIAIDRRTIIVIVASAAIPMIPLFFLTLPFEDIIARVIGMGRG